MITAADELRFEYAAQLRDELRELRRDLGAAADRAGAHLTRRRAGRATIARRAFA